MAESGAKNMPKAPHEKFVNTLIEKGCEIQIEKGPKRVERELAKHAKDRGNRTCWDLKQAVVLSL